MRKKHIFNIAYLLLMICLTLIGSYTLTPYRDYVIAGGINHNAYLVLIVLSMLFPYVLGVLLASEHLYSEIKERKPITYNGTRFWCISFPLILILVYSILSRWVPAIGIHIPSLPNFGVMDPSFAHLRRWVLRSRFQVVADIHVS